MAKRFFPTAVVFALFIIFYPTGSYAEREKFCTTLKELIRASATNFIMFRGAQIEKDAESTYFVGQKTFDRLNDCQVVLSNNPDDWVFSFYACTNGGFDSSYIEISHLWSSTAKFSNDCLNSSDWSTKQKIEEGNQKIFHDWTISNKDVKVLVRFVEKKVDNSAHPSKFMATIAISRRKVDQ